jgi:parallel beta-helix repeat protein
VNGQLYYHSYGIPNFVVKDVVITNPKITNCGAINLYGNDTVIENVTVTGHNYTGIFVTRGNNVTISQSNISGNAPLGGYYDGIRVEFSTNVTIENSNMSGNAEYGIYLLSTNSNVTISGSNISGNKYGGIFINKNNQFVNISSSTFVSNLNGGVYTWYSGAGDANNRNVTIFKNSFTNQTSNGVFIHRNNHN